MEQIYKREYRCNMLYIFIHAFLNKRELYILSIRPCQRKPMDDKRIIFLARFFSNFYFELKLRRRKPIIWIFQ